MSSKVRTVKRQSDWSSPVQAEPERFSGITTKRYYLVKWIAMITMLIDHLAFLLHSDCGLDSTTYIACLLYTSPSPRDRTRTRLPSSPGKEKGHRPRSQPADC